MYVIKTKYEINKIYVINPFHTTGLFHSPLKTSENQMFSDAFRGVDRDQWHEMGSRQNMSYWLLVIFHCFYLLNYSIL